MSEAVVKVSGLRKCYGPVVAVDALDLEVPRGAVFGLLGPNGAGKSTTFGVMCGWLRATAGTATVLGTPSHDLHRLHGRVSALPQDAMFPRAVTVRDQLVHFGRLQGLSPEQANQEAERCVAAVSMKDSLDRRGGELSHGMLKRVGLAQTMLGKPEVVFLDEPTAGLDPAAARQLKDLIAAMAPEVTVIVSSHNLAEVQELCTHGAILDHGKRVVHGTIDEMTRRGAEVAIDVAAGAKVPRQALAAAFGDDQVEVKDRVVRITFSSNEDAAQVIGKALRLLLDGGVPILGVRRGTSLEHAFLAATAQPVDKT